MVKRRAVVILLSIMIISLFSGCSEQEIEQGLGDIIQETVNPRTLQSTVKNLVEETGSLPEDLAEVLNVYDTYEIGRRKETNKATKKAKGGN